MNHQRPVAELQDQVFTIGGSLITYTGELPFEDTILPDIHLPEYVVVVHIPWYKRLWDILNTDVRVLWREVRQRWMGE